MSNWYYCPPDDPPNDRYRSSTDLLRGRSQSWMRQLYSALNTAIQEPESNTPARFGTIVAIHSVEFFYWSRELIVLVDRYDSNRYWCFNYNQLKQDQRSMVDRLL